MDVSWPTIIVGLFFAVATVVVVRRKVIRREQLRLARTDAGVRRRLIEELRDELEHDTAASRASSGVAQLTHRAGAVAARYRLAELLLLDGRAEEAMELACAPAVRRHVKSAGAFRFESLQLDDNWVPLEAFEAAVCVNALSELGRWSDLSRALSAYGRSAAQRDPLGCLEARALVCSHQGKPDEALKLLDGGPPDDSRLRLARVRVLANAGRGDEELWQKLEGLPRELLERYAERFSSEPAAPIARRVLDRASPYR
jgi:hypothetical protein